MAFIVGHKRERDVGRLEERQSGKFGFSERGISGLVFGEVQKMKKKNVPQSGQVMGS